MDLKAYLREVASLEYRKILFEDFEKTGFIKKLESIQDPERVFDFLVKSLGHTKQGGQARITFPLNDEMVVKFAYDGDYAQNRTELQNAQCLGEKYSVKVLHHHPEFWWLIEERVQILNVDQFHKKVFENTGVQLFHVFAFPDAVQTEIHGRVSNKAAMDNQDLMKSPWYRGLVEALRKCNVKSDDFHYANWGVRPSTGELVLLDTGKE